MERDLDLSFYSGEEAALSGSSSFIEYTQIELLLPLLSAAMAVVYFFWLGSAPSV